MSNRYTIDVNMEPQSQIIIRDYGICRCCAARGNHRDITKEYYHNGIREMFFDIFVECFNLYLSKHKDLTMLICSSCVSRLRDANAFRMTVVSTQEQLLAAIPDNDTEITSIAQVSTQELEDSCTNLKTNDQTNANYENDTQSLSDDRDEVIEDLGAAEDEAKLLARFNGKALRSLPTRRTLLGYCPTFVSYLDSLKDKIITPKAIKEMLEHAEPKRPKTPTMKMYVTEKMANTINACTLFEFSNATAFKTKTKFGYPCFYCRQIYDNMDILRAHQIDHPKTSLFKLLSKYSADSLVVYADITDLKCTLCDVPVPSLNELKAHLTKVHRKRLYTKFEDRVIPFKLKGDSDFECQICRFSFETFGSIERHMNVHYRNSICEQCGAGFVTIKRLKIHNQAVHNEGNFPCNVCKKVYTSYNKYKIHIDTVHNMQRKNKCPKCPERFIDYFTRRKHLVEKHGYAPILYRCRVCDRSFSRRFSLSGHMKRCHLVQKDFQCDNCPYKCFTKRELRVHMMRHMGGEGHVCSVCGKTFSLQKPFKDHMMVHESNGRFACSECGQTFVQDSNLKGHIKAHHAELTTAM